MFRPGRNPKEQAGGEQPAEPQPPAPSAHNQNEDTQQRYRASEPNTNTGARANMSDGQLSGTSRAVSESEALARDIKEGTLSGFVGNGTNVTGEANFKGMLRVDGHLSGRVSSADGTLIVSTGGQVDANIDVSVAQIYGTVNGDITATKRIEMGRVAKVTGNIQTPALVIENGAIFEGSCRMVQIKEQAEKGQSKETSSSATSATSSSPPSSSETPASSGNSGYNPLHKSGGPEKPADVKTATDIPS